MYPNHTIVEIKPNVYAVVQTMREENPSRLSKQARVRKVVEELSEQEKKVLEMTKKNLSQYTFNEEQKANPFRTNEKIVRTPQKGERDRSSLKPDFGAFEWI